MRAGTAFRLRQTRLILQCTRPSVRENAECSRLARNANVAPAGDDPRLRGELADGVGESHCAPAAVCF
jgi:hypothetical protein